MTAMNFRLSLFILVIAAAPLQEAEAQAGRLEGAWLEEGSPCASVFLATSKAVAFKRPANAFAQAFIISGRNLSTPLATCRLAGVKPSGERQIVRLSCTTSVSTDTARAVLALTADGVLSRYLSLEGDVTTRYQRCTRGSLKAP